MKHVVSVLLVAAAIMAIGNAQTNKPRTVEQIPLASCASAPRYQLFAGEHIISGSNGVPATMKDILRIDTLTGQTSQWANGNKDGQVISFWRPIDSKSN